MKPAVTQAKLLIPRLPAGLPAWTTFFQAATTEKPATMSAPKTALPIVFGAMTFGTPGIEGVNEILDVFQAHGPQLRRGLSATECALRWLRHHRSPEEGGPAMRSSSARAARSSSRRFWFDLEKGPLPEEVVRALDAAWQRVKGVVPKYLH